MTGRAMLGLALPTYADQVGLTNTVIGLIMAGAGIGGVASQARIGSLVAQRTARTVIIWSLALMAATTVPIPAVTDPWLLGGLRTLWGVGSVGLIVGMQTRLTRATTVADRGRAMATWGGMVRASVLIGPVAAGYLIEHINYRAAFFVAASLCGVAIIPMRRSAPLPPRAGSERAQRTSTWQAVQPYQRLVVSTGMAHLLVMSGRFGRALILPLIGLDLGMSESELGLLLAASAGADLALSPVSGWLMDRFGRLYAIVPAFGGFALGLILLGLATTVAQVVAAAAIIGAFNGLGSGTMLTVSADLAPPEATSQFLSAVGTLRDFGMVLGPLLVGALADAAGFDVAAFALAAVTLAGLGVLVFVLGDTGRHAHAQA